MELKGAWVPQLLTKIRGRIVSRKGGMIRIRYHSTIELKEGWRTTKGDPLVLPSGPITRSHTKRYWAAMSLYVQDQVTQELNDLAFNNCCVELEGTPRLLTLLEARGKL
ncbi:hypothetical protein JCGZ_19377 [Jatropha curcas]|uniref:Uncharacterized protein n=1 Tax=Jatropha curcas TaxID=180498 RepID=A0A067K025_JATCU|nr:hypothetical protein JCGZ_19377 [Jatropha curcas]